MRKKIILFSVLMGIVLFVSACAGVEFTAPLASQGSKPAAAPAPGQEKKEQLISVGIGSGIRIKSLNGKAVNISSGRINVSPGQNTIVLDASYKDGNKTLTVSDMSIRYNYQGGRSYTITISQKNKKYGILISNDQKTNENFNQFK